MISSPRPSVVSRWLAVVGETSRHTSQVSTFRDKETKNDATSIRI